MLAFDPNAPTETMRRHRRPAAASAGTFDHLADRPESIDLSSERPRSMTGARRAPGTFAATSQSSLSAYNGLSLSPKSHILEYSPKTRRQFEAQPSHVFAVQAEAIAPPSSLRATQRFALSNRGDGTGLSMLHHE